MGLPQCAFSSFSRLSLSLFFFFFFLQIIPLVRLAFLVLHFTACMPLLIFLLSLLASFFLLPSTWLCLSILSFTDWFSPRCFPSSDLPLVLKLIFAGIPINCFFEVYMCLPFLPGPPCSLRVKLLLWCFSIFNTNFNETRNELFSLSELIPYSVHSPFRQQSLSDN